MNRFEMEDTKYVFRPPKYSAFWAAIFAAISNYKYRLQEHRVTKIETSGADKLRELYKNGHSLLLTPNHSDHCDPHVLTYLSRRYKAPLNFMSARETFEKGFGINGFILQRMGAFSVDREGADIQAIKQAMSILQEGKYPLVMFPEGEIYHLNEQLTPLNEGAATLALRVAKKMKTSERKVYIVPVAMKYGYIDDISSTFPDRMAVLEDQITWKPQEHLNIVDRLYKYGEALLALKEKEFLDYTLDGDLDSRLIRFQEILISEQEEKYFQKIEEGNHPARIRKLRGKIRTILLDEENRPDDETIKDCRRSLDRLYLAIQLYSYPSRYLREKPSMNRIAETIHKFEEDILRKTRIAGNRSVEVTFCEPIDLMAMQQDYEADAKAAVSRVTEQIESAIRSILE